MFHHGLVTEQSRKAKAAKSLYDYLRHKVKQTAVIASFQSETFEGVDGVKVPAQDKYRVLNIRLHDEHLSPYFKTDMNLFHMLMLDDSVEMTVFKAEHGWLFVFDGIPATPAPFGSNGFDTR